MSFQLHYVTHSEIGLIRKNNQDSGFASPHLLVVADGMGGAAAGDLASAVAVDTIKDVATPVDGPAMLDQLARALHQANDRIADLVEADLSLDGMGTTVTGALFDGHGLGLAHIGDSRAYLLRDGHLRRLTHDHSWVQSLVDEGKISDAEAAVHPHRSLLLKVLNGQGANEPDLTVVPVELGDRVMFCSDGVCGLVDDDVIEQGLQRPSAEEALEFLVSEALAEGGIDNITVIVADVVEGPGSTDPVVLGAAAERDIPTPEAQAAAAQAALEDDDEDTVVTQRVAPADPPAEPEDEARYNPVPPHHHRFRPLLGLVVLVLVLAAGLTAAYGWTRTQYFVGAAGDQVAIYKGLSQSLPGVRLSSLYELQPLKIAELPPYYQDKVRSSIDVSNLESARQTVQTLADAAKRCKGRSDGTPAASPTPTGTPSASATFAPEDRC